MLQDLKRLHDAFDMSPLKGDYEDAERLTQELSVSTSFYVNESKT